MGRPPKKSCNACCSVSETPTPDPPGTPDPNPDPNYRSPTSCDDMINIVLLGSTMVSTNNLRGWSQSRTQEEIDNEYNSYRAAYPNRTHIVLEVFPSYLPGYMSKYRPRILYPADYHDSQIAFDFSYFKNFTQYADKDQSGQANWWSRINEMINSPSLGTKLTEVQNLFNNSSQVCVDIISDSHLEEQFRHSSTILGFKYNTLLDDILKAGKDLVLPVGRRGLTNRKLRTKAFFSGFAHHECCNSAAADSFRKILTATPNCSRTIGEEPDSEYTLQLSDIKSGGEHFTLFRSTCTVDSNNRDILNLELNAKLFKGDSQIFDRAVSYVLQKKDIRPSHQDSGMGDSRVDADGRALDSFSDLFPLAVEYPDKTLFRPLNIEDTHQHSRIPLKYAKTFKAADEGQGHLRDIDLISITHPGDLGTQKLRNLPLLKDYPSNGDAKLFRRAHAPDWFRLYNIPIDFMAVSKGGLGVTRVFVKRPLTDFDALSSRQFLYGGEGQPTCGTMEGTRTVGSDENTRNLAHFLLRTANEKDGENNVHLGNKYSERWLQNEWVQIGDSISSGSSSNNDNVKLACHRYSLNDPDGTFTSLYLARSVDNHKITIYLYDPDGTSDLRDENGGHIGRWNSVGNINLQTILEDLPSDHRPVAGKASTWHAKPLLYQCRILDFKVKHVNNEENTFETDKYLLVGDAIRQHIYVLKESNSSGNFELLFYTMGHDASMNAACDKLVVSACNNSTTTGSSATFNPARTADLGPQRGSASWDNYRLYTLPDGTHNNWFNTSVFSIPDSPATNALVEPDVVFSEANGYLLELASCHTVNMEAAGNAFVFTPSRRFRNDNSDLIMGMCQYIYPAARTFKEREEIEKRKGHKTLYYSYVTAAGQFKAGWNCKKSDLIYAKDIPSLGIRTNFLNPPNDFFHFGPDSYPLHWDTRDKPQIVLSHPVDIAGENALSQGAVNAAHKHLNHGIDYVDPPGYEVAIPFYQYPNVAYKGERTRSLNPSDTVVVMGEKFSTPTESTNDRGMISNTNTDKSYITERNEAFHRLSRPGKVFLFKYTNYHGWSYRKMIPDRNGTFPNPTELHNGEAVKDATTADNLLPAGIDSFTGHNVTDKPGLDSDVIGGAFIQDDRVFDYVTQKWVSPFGATGPHTQLGDYGDVGKFCRFVNTIDPAVNPRDVHRWYYIRDYKTMVFSDVSKNYPDAKQSNGSYKYTNAELRSDIHTFFIKSGLTSKPHRFGVQYIPFYQNHRFATTPDLLDLDIVPADNNCDRSPYIPFPFDNHNAPQPTFTTTIQGDNVSQFGFSYLFQSPLLTTAAGESLGFSNPVFRGGPLIERLVSVFPWMVPLDLPRQYISFSDFNPDIRKEGQRKGPHLYDGSKGQYFRFERSTSFDSLSRNQSGRRVTDRDFCDRYFLPRRQFRIKAVHIRDDGTEDVAFSEVFYMNVFNRRRTVD